MYGVNLILQYDTLHECSLIKWPSFVLGSWGDDWSEDQWTGSVRQNLELIKKLNISSSDSVLIIIKFFLYKCHFYLMTWNEHVTFNFSSQNPKCSHLQPKTPRKLKIPTAWMIPRTELVRGKDLVLAVKIREWTLVLVFLIKFIIILTSVTLSYHLTNIK